jgi:hypothetical protein
MPRSFEVAAFAVLLFESTASAQCVGYSIDSPPAFASAGMNVVAVVDMNGDGGLDLVSDQSVFFDFKREVAFPGTARAAADLNRDGWPDIIAIADGRIEVLINNRNETFTLKPTSLLTDDPNHTPLTVGDFNGDGVPDVIFGVTPKFAAQDGGGGFRPPETAAQTGVESIVSGDFNGDSRRDFAAFYAQSLTTGIFAGQGNGTFIPERTTFGPASNLLAADFDRDGRDDIIGSAARSGLGTLVIAWGNINRSPTTVTDPLGGTIDAGIPLATGDANGDGAPDVLATIARSFPGQTTIETVVFLNDGRGNFSVTFRTPGAFDGTFADFDRDGKLDLVNSATFYRGNGDGTFLDIARTPALRSDVAVAGDFDGDGDDDIGLRSADFGASRVAIEWRESNGSFTRQILTDPRVTNLLGAADVNGDGRAELLTLVGAVLNAVDVARDGSLQTIASVPVTSFGTQVATGRFLGDGSIELAVLTSNSEVQILDPRGTPFLRASWKLPDSDSHSVAIADMNRDGRDDVVVVGRGQRTSCTDPPCGGFLSGGFVSLYLSTGVGFTTERRLFNKPDSLLGSPAVGDFNGDGNKDIDVVALSGELVMLAGDGNGSFSIQSSPLAGAVDAVAADLNGDGIDDIVAIGNGTLTILLGSRSGMVVNGMFASAPLFSRVLLSRQTPGGSPTIAVASEPDLLLLTPRCANRQRAVRH